MADLTRAEVEHIAAYCAEEVRRQGRGPLQVAHMVNAWLDAIFATTAFSRSSIERWGMKVEPELNREGWRTVPVYVGRHVPPPVAEIPRLMKRYEDTFALMTPSATLASGSGPRTPVGYGPSSPVRFAHFDPDTSSWRTSQLSWGEDSSRSSPTWPRSGMTRSGTAFRLPPLAPRTSAIASGLLPTPEASNTKAVALRSAGREPKSYLCPTPRAAQGGGDRERWGNGPTLQDEARRWPTPTRADGERHSERMMRGNPTLLGAARLWPTPRASANENRQTKPTPSQLAGKHGMNLATAVNWPTPRASDGAKGGPNQRGSKGDLTLPAAVQPFRTPSSRDWKGMSAASWLSRTQGDLTPTLPDQVGGQLNPTWVEWLMGFPIGWTDCGHSETRSCRKSSSRSAAGSLPSMRPAP